MDEPIRPLRLLSESADSQIPTRLFLVGRRSYIDLLQDHLERTGRFRVVGKAATFSEHGLQRQAHTSDFRLIDPGVSGGSIVDAMQRVAGQTSIGPIAIMASRWTQLMLKIALDANLRGFLLADEPMEGLIDKLLKMIAGERCFSEAIERELIRDPKTGAVRLREPGAICEFSRRELTVVKYLADGLSVKQVATQMDSTYKAIDSVKYRVMQRLGLRNRVELTRYAIREGLAAA